MLACRVFGDSVTVNLIDEQNYAAYSFANTSGLNARKVVQLMMYMQNTIFGTELFEVKDDRLFDGNMADSNQKKIIKVKAIKVNSNSTIADASNANNGFTYIDLCFEECCYCGV